MPVEEAEYQLEMEKDNEESGRSWQPQGETVSGTVDKFECC